MVKCELCKQGFGQISEKHLRSAHHMSFAAYKRKFPNSETLCQEARLAISTKVSANKERSQKISQTLKNRVITWGNKISQVKKKQCLDPEYAKKIASTFTRRAWEAKPTKPEQFVGALLDYLEPEKWAYVGNWAVNLGGLNPDFMNVNGEKLLVEVFGDYWHKGENPQKRIAHFNKFGFSTLVIWEKELSNPEKVLERIRNFLSVETLHEPSLVDEDKVRHSLKEEITV